MKNQKIEAQDSLEVIKEKLEALKEENPNIHINLRKSRKKLQNHPVYIKSVHKNFFIVENRDGNYPASYTVQYAELLTGEVEILEA